MTCFVVPLPRISLWLFLGALTLLASMEGFSIAQERVYGFFSPEKVATTSSRLADNSTIQTATSLLNATGLQLNADATLASDIVSIEHLSDESQVVISMKKGAQCPRPYLIGRLSGPSLVKVDQWRWTQKLDGTTQLLGIYQVPVAGTYFVEILAVYCDNFLYDYLETANPQMDADPFSPEMRHLRSFDFKSTCMEDPFRQSLTAHQASIEVTATIANNSPVPIKGNGTSWTGHWLSTSASSPQPVYTRHQPYSCYEARELRNQKELPSECDIPTNRKAHSSYKFQWEQPAGPIRPARDLKQPKPTYICVVGKSHSRSLMKASKAAGVTIRRNQLNLQYQWIQAAFPDNVTEAVLSSNMTCDKLIIGVGQWAASYKRGSLLEDYYNQIIDMLDGLQKRAISATTGEPIPVFLRSIHYNPLGHLINTCPPEDWRNPLVIDGYNAVLQQASRAMGVPFLDTNFLAAPIWDAAPDWYHLDEATSIKEVLYLTASVFGVEPPLLTTLKTQTHH